MSAKTVGLIDYDMGNLKSVAHALEKVGLKVKTVDSPSKLKGISALVLPGVGAFRVAVKNLRTRKLFEPVREWIETKKPFLGICLGYQLLFEEGKEGGTSEKGLGIFKGKVKKFPSKNNLKIPHMGWNKVMPVNKKIFSGIGKTPYFYFVHSYFPVPEDKNLIAAKTEYGMPFSSCIAWNHSFACQFHPEKSGANGLRLLKNFAAQIPS